MDWDFFIVAGYIGAALSHEERLCDLSLAAYLRQEQLARLRGRTWRQEELLPRRWQKVCLVSESSGKK